MGLPYISAATAHALRTAAHYFIPARLDTDTPICVSNWFRDHVSALPGRPEETYHGGGWLADLPSLLSILDGTAQDVSIRLSGVEPELIDLFVTRAPTVRNRLIEIGVQPLDARWQPLTGVVLLARLTGQRLSYSYEPGARSRAQATITLSARNGDTSRRRGLDYHWVSAQYKSPSAGSTLCDWTARYTSSYASTWPRA